MGDHDVEDLSLTHPPHRPVSITLRDGPTGVIKKMIQKNVKDTKALSEPSKTALSIAALLTRMAEALERLAPPPPPAPHFGAARMFRYDAETGAFASAPDFSLPLDLLLGVDRQKARLVENLRRFATDLPFNNVLRWGARGTGKSSMLKAAIMHLSDRHPALKLVEIDREAIDALPRLFGQLRDREERFAVLCDDLSFEEGAAAAKSLKSALEGGVAGPPGNVVFVATSNRRHLMPRNHGEGDGPLAAAEDAEEMVSASDRFGLWIGFPPMDQPTYLAAVAAYVDRFGLDRIGAHEEPLERRALQWAQLRGGRSGRVAFQFVRDLAGEQGHRIPV
jgi:predicted AAA+ superfamily ATPase